MPSKHNAVHESKITAYLDDVERFAGRKFHFRREMEYLFICSTQSAMRNIYDDLLSTAKFVSNAHSILKRVGPDNQEIGNLVREYQESLKNSTRLLRLLLSSAHDPTADEIERELFLQTQPGLENLLNFLYDLSWIKNFILDNEQRVPSC
jgi:hypothetical protein